MFREFKNGTRFIIVLTVLNFSSTGFKVAYAADLPTYSKASPVVAPFSWTGFYVGANVGYGQSTASSAQYTAIEQTFFGGRIASGEIPSSLTANARGFLGGVQAGYNYQTGPQSMFGFETDIAYSGISGDRTKISIPLGFDPVIITTQKSTIDWFGTFRGRVGWLATPSFLIYATGGLAYGQGKAETHTTVAPGPIGAPPTCGPLGNIFCSDGSSSKTRVGWTVGGGLEHMIGRNWSVKAEYLYYDLGGASYTVFTQSPPPPAVMQADTSFKGQIFRFGLNYKFDLAGPM